jgi:hypothetical protein
MTPRLAVDLGNRNNILAKAEFQGKVEMTNFRTALIGLAVSAALMGSQALAADVSLVPGKAAADSLLPGKPAGVKEAQRRARSPNLLWIGAGVAVATAAVMWL